MDKKKFHGGLKLLLLPLFITLLGMCSICYAENAPTPINQMNIEIAQAIFDNFYENNYFATYGMSTEFNNFYDNLNDNSLSSFVSSFNSNNYLNTYASNIENLLFVCYKFNSNIFIRVYFTNNMIGNTADYLQFQYFASNYINFKNLSLASDGTSAIYGHYVQFQLNQNGTITNWTQDGINASNGISQTGLSTVPGTATTNPNVIDFNMGCCYNVIPAIKFKDGNWYTLANRNIVRLPEPEPEPEPPSIDPTGTITNSSGDTTGSIDLSGIQQGIGNIQNQISGDTQNIINNQNINTQSIIDNQNENTQATVNAINNANGNYWGNSGDLTGDEQEDFISDSINSLVADVSGELSKNAVFEHLDSAEDIFLDFFRNKQNESYYDLIISWDAVAPVITMFGGSVTVSDGQSIIAGDSINISQLCRDNPELATIQQYIRIIFNFSCLIALLWQIYNLILSTLGIDNPYLYEDADVTDVVNGDTGEVRTFYRTHKRYYKKR